MRGLSALAIAAALLSNVGTSVVEAQLHVGSLRGPRGRQVRAALVRALQDRELPVVDSEQDASVTLSGRVWRRGGRWRATVRVRGRTEVDQRTVRGAARTPRALAAQVARRLAHVLEGLGTPERPEPRGERHETASSPRRVVVGEFRGRGAGQARGALVASLSSAGSVELVPRAELEATGADLTSAAGLVEAASRLRVSAYLTGMVSRRGSGWTARITVRSGADGAVVEEVELRGRNLRSLQGVLRRRGWSRLSSAVESTQAPERVAVVDPGADRSPEPDDTVVDGTGVGDADEAATDGVLRDEALPNALDMAILAHPFSRRLVYNDDLYGLLREYSLGLGPAFRLAARWYPGAHFTAGWGAYLGVDILWERAFAIDSKRADGEVFPTRSQAWYLGLRGRIPLGRHEVSVGLGYGRHTFVIDSAGPSQPGRLNIPQVPGVDYRSVATQVEMRLAPVAGLRITLSGAYLFLLDLGGIGSDRWFPRAKAGGIEAAVTLGWETSSGIELRLGWDVRRYFYRFEPEVGDPFIAGGAIDQYFGYSFGLAYRL